MLKNEDAILEKINRLLNKKLSSIGRAGSMLWVGFGKWITKKNYRDEIRKVNEYSLHVSCSWRFTDGKNIIMASRDMYLPKNGEYIDDFDWDVIGNNRFDERINIIHREINKNIITVDELKIDKYGSLIVQFNNGYVLEVFPDDSLEEEYWRFISNINESEHLVIFEEE